jgi:hypothetical protein
VLLTSLCIVEKIWILCLEQSLLGTCKNQATSLDTSLTLWVFCYYTVWAADFKAPAGQHHFLFFSFFLGQHWQKKQTFSKLVFKSLQPIK